MRASWATRRRTADDTVEASTVFTTTGAPVCSSVPSHVVTPCPLFNRCEHRNRPARIGSSAVVVTPGPLCQAPRPGRAAFPGGIGRLAGRLERVRSAQVALWGSYFAETSIEGGGGMTPEQLARRLDGVQIVDVRWQNEWDAGRIDGAVHIPADELEDRLDELRRDSPVVTVCLHGNRSANAAEL